jgi:hypothetical protein
MTSATPAVITAATVAVAVTFPATSHADDDTPPLCSSGQVTITASPTLGAVGHRAVPLTFTLAQAAPECTLTGYPGVDAVSGGPIIHAERTPRGYMGGLPPSVAVPPTVILSTSQQAQAIVEGRAVDADGSQCPTYTDLQVTPPDTTDTVTVAASIDTCQLQVHPVTAD